MLVTFRRHRHYPGMKNSVLPCLILPFALAGCVDDPTRSDQLDPDELGETAQEVTSTALSSHTCSTTSPCNFNLGTATNRACFLAGIRGAAAGSFVAVLATGGDNVLTIYAPTNGVPITATTVCVQPAANVTSQRWNTNFGVSSVAIANTTASSRCFLNIFSGQGGGLTHYNDSIRTWREPNGTWRIGGHADAGSYLSGGAICFDVAANKGEWSWGQGVPGSITGNLASNAGGGVACGLTELGGVFTTNSGSDGVHLGFNSAANQWIWTLVNFKHAFANCIK